ncbi:MAG: hypothetical protein A2W91_18350 [Bacteroidetes bacterium GWF2_38_335]|nr:MAG: hypothetical protein A2W91_18350 [Bacteroidetes bacterium GWF2_38_335]OFY80073.1 MAG: hypothetical protein A2281_12285 [Bacteroidetes bacterium RIFOXYA12_FULL_38_20]HBS88602.1 hypothetical protein [Bacteroidales bacterium]
MKNQLKNIFISCFFIFCLLHGIISNSQPILTSEDITPLPGETFTMNFMEYTWIDAENSGGENKIWDFSDLGISSSYEMTCLEVTGSPFEDYFGSSSYCILIDFSSPRYLYYSIENNFLNEEGYGSINVVETSEDPISWVHYPITYSDIFIDTIKTSYYTTAGDTFRTDEGICHCKADGYGTLILFDATYEDVIRIRCIDTFRVIDLEDTLDIIGNRFYWYKENFHHYIFLLGGNTSYSATYVIPTPNINLEIENKTDPSVYPNPIVEDINIVIPFHFEEAVIEIMDINGNKVFNDKISSSRYKADIGFLSPGFYYARIFVNSEVYNYKIIKIE